MIPQERVNEAAETANDYMTPGNHRAFNDGFDCGVRFAESEMKQTAMEFAEWCIVHAWEIDYREQKSHTISKLFSKFEAERNQQQSELTCPECLSNRILEWPDKYQCRKCEHVWERSAK